MPRVDPLTGQVGQRGQVGLCRKPLRLKIELKRTGFRFTVELAIAVSANPGKLLIAISESWRPLAKSWLRKSASRPANAGLDDQLVDRQAGSHGARRASRSADAECADDV